MRRLHGSKTNMGSGRFVVGLALTLAACPQPTDGAPQIAVTPGAAARAGRMSRFSAAAKKDAGAAAPAHAHPLVPERRLGGPNAIGKAGDWVIENDEVVFVVDGLGTSSGFEESGGNLVDAADARLRKDELGQLFTYFGTFPRQAVYTTIDAKDEQDGSAVILARGHELYEADVDVTTEYRLAGGDRALLLRTTLHNRGKSAVTGLGLGDAIQWGGAEKFAPGKAVGFAGPSKGPFLGGIGRFTSYAITSTEGEIGAMSGGAWSDTEQKSNVTIAPGASVTYERVFVVGQRPDAASVVSELTRAAGGDVGAVEIALVDQAGKRVRAPAGAKVVLGTASDPAVLSLVATGTGDAIAGEVPKGRWKVAFAPSAGRRGDGKSVDVDVNVGAVSRATLTVTEPSSTKLGPCTSAGRPIPCKLTIEGTAGTASPDFGPAYAAGPAKNQITMIAGETVTLPLAHGTYRVTASRGPEYELAVRDIVLPRDEAVAPFELRHVIATDGWVAADFHQHTTLSADSAVATRDRVIANAAEGVEVAVATEHNVVTDFAPIAKELGLSPFFVSIRGDEITTDASKKPWGHANVFPLPVRDDRPRGGAIAARDRTPKDAFAEVRAMPGGPRVITVNHPRNKDNGYFNLLGFDPKTGRGTDPRYDDTFDAIEVWSGRHVDGRERVLSDWFSVLRNGHPVTPVAATDTHGVVGQEAGYPRTYVHVGKDDALDGWDDARSADFVRAIREKRDVFVTNGPFLSVTANGEGMGSIVRARGGAVEVKIKVVTASWNAVERAEIRRVRDGSKTPVALRTSGANVREGTATLRAASDDAFVVVVEGDKPMRPVLVGGEDTDVHPWAMSAPIWIDAEGDAKSLGRSLGR